MPRNKRVAMPPPKAALAKAQEAPAKPAGPTTWTRPRLTSREQEALAALREIEHWHIERGERDDPHVAALSALIRKFQ